MAKNEGLGGKKTNPSYVVTGGSIVTPVAAFEGGIFSGSGSGPTAARGRNKESGADAFPLGTSGASKRSNPLGAFGLGGKK